MPGTDIETKTGLGLSEKIGIGFMVGVGLVVVTSFLVAAGYLGWSKLTAVAPTVSQTLTPPSNINTAGVTNTTPTVEGTQSDRSFSTE